MQLIVKLQGMYGFILFLRSRFDWRRNWSKYRPLLVGMCQLGIKYLY